MLRASTCCAEPGCGKKSVQGTRWCEAHQTNNYAAEREAERYKFRCKDSVWQMYQHPRWKAFRFLVRAQNPICQKLIDGQQCMRASELVHHLISPRQNPDLFLYPSNVIALCHRCHPSDEGTPGWKVDVDYVPTKFEISYGGNMNELPPSE